MADSKSQKEYNEQLRQTQSLLASMQREMGKMADAADKRNKKLEQYYSLNKKILGDLNGEEKARKKIDKIEEKLLTLGIKRRNASGTEKKQIDDQISSLESKRQSLENTFSSSLSLENINDRLLQLSQLQNDLSKDNLGVNEGKKQGMKLQLQAQEELLKKHRSELQILGSVNNVVDSVSQKYDGIVSSVENGLRKIPLIGDVLADATKPFTDNIKSEINIVSGKFKEGFSKNFLKVSAESGSFSKAFSSGLSGGIAEGRAALQGLGSTMTKLGPMLANPITLAIAAIVAVGVLGVIAYNKVAEAAKQFRAETGLLNSQTQEIAFSINGAYRNTVQLGASMEEVSTAASTFTKEFDNLSQPSEAVLTNMVTLNKNFGVGVSESAKLNKVFQNMAGLSAEQAQYQISQVASASKLAGVAPHQVIKDMADSSEYAYKYFGGSVEELSKAAVEAAKLGTSIAQAGKIADNLLDFQNSISSELEAQAMLGVRLNFGQARYLAANGDILGSQQAIIDQVQQNVDLTRLNTYEQEALAKATGMPIADLKNQIRIREQFGKLDKEQMATAMDLLNSGKDLSKVSQKDLETRTKELERQREMQSEMDNIKNQLKAAGSSLLQAFMPIGMVIMQIFSQTAAFLQGFFKPIGDAINSVMVALKPVGDIFKEMFGQGAGLSGIFEIIGKILSGPIVFGINLFVNGIKMVASLITGVYDVFKGIFTGDFSLVADGLMSIGEGILRFFYQIPMALFDTFMQMFPSLGDWFSSIGTKILDGIRQVGPNLTNLFTNIVKGWFNIITFIPTKLYEAFVGIFPQIGDFFSNLIDTIKQKLLGLLPSWAQKALGKSSSSEVQEQQQMVIPVTESGIIRDDGVPMMAEGGIVQSPIQAIVGEAGPEAVIPLDQLSNIIASTTGGQGGGRPSWVDEVVSAIRENKDVYMDRIKVSSTVTDTQERSGRQNRFGLQGA